MSNQDPLLGLVDQALIEQAKKDAAEKEAIIASIKANGIWWAAEEILQLRKNRAESAAPEVVTAPTGKITTALFFEGKIAVYDEDVFLGWNRRREGTWYLDVGNGTYTGATAEEALEAYLRAAGTDPRSVGDQTDDPE